MGAIDTVGTRGVQLFDVVAIVAAALVPLAAPLLAWIFKGFLTPKIEGAAARIAAWRQRYGLSGQSLQVGAGGVSSSQTELEHPNGMTPRGIAAAAADCMERINFGVSGIIVVVLYLTLLIQDDISQKSRLRAAMVG